MTSRKYYSERMGLSERANERLDLEQLKFLFKRLFYDFRARGFLAEAEGYQQHAMLGINRIGRLGSDIPRFVKAETGLTDVWPVSQKIQQYDKKTLFTMIEFLFDYISSPKKQYFDGELEAPWFAMFEKSAGKADYKIFVNKLLERYEDGYMLTWDGEIVSLPASGFEGLVEETLPSDEKEKIEVRVEDFDESIASKVAHAKRKFLRHDSSINERREAVRVLGDVLEYLRKSDIRLEGKDEIALFQILNRFSIRHHEKSQMNEYAQDLWLEYFFYCMLASVRVLLRRTSVELDE